MTCTRSRKEGEIHLNLSFCMQNKRRLTMLRNKKKFLSMMLSLLHLIQTLTDYFLLHCDCSIERFSNVVTYSVYYDQPQRLLQVRFAFRVRIIRLKNMHTDQRGRDRRETKPSISLTKSKCTSDFVVVIRTSVVITSFYYCNQV